MLPGTERDFKKYNISPDCILFPTSTTSNN